MNLFQQSLLFQMIEVLPDCFVRYVQKTNGVRNPQRPLLLKQFYNLIPPHGDFRCFHT